MKNVYLFLIQALMALSLVCATGCSKDDPGSVITPEPTYPDGGDSGGTNTPPSDPEGTITLSVRNVSNGKTAVPLYSGIDFGIDNGNNFYSGSAWHFVSVGQVQGLGNITKIPDTGWSTKCAVMTGYGYVGVCAGDNRMTFVRIYVDDVIIGAGNGGVIGYVVKYQYPFNGTAGAIGLSSKSIKLDAYSGTEGAWSDSNFTGYCAYGNIYNPISLNKVSCSINNVGNYFGDFSFDGTKVSLVIINISKTTTNPTLTVSSPGLSDEKIVVSP